MLQQLEQWPRVIEVLQSSNGVFQAVLRTNLVNDLVLRGYLLLGEAYLAQKDFARAESVLQPIGKLVLDPIISWQRQYLVCRIQLADNRPEDALRGTTNLMFVAAQTEQPAFQAQSAAFQAGILERLSRPDQAILAYTNNLNAAIPPDRQREALLEIARLALLQNSIGEAVQRLEEFLTRFPAAAAADLAWLTVGELRLRQCVSGIGADTSFGAGTTSATSNCLEEASAALRSLPAHFPQSPYLGKAELDLGWCYWFQARAPESQSAFQSAVDRLSPSPDQAIACFKLADAQFQQTNYAGALANYQAVNARFSAFPEVTTNLMESALYHTVRSAVAANNLAACTNALQKLLDGYPESFNSGGAVLLAGQWRSRQGSPAEARAIFLSAAGLGTNTPLLPEVLLAVARTYEQETNWDEAIRQYDAWLDRFPANSDARARAEYCRGVANFQAGHETAALACLTDFIAHFTNDFTPLAQWSVATYFFNSADFFSAEKYYQDVALSSPANKIAYESILMAGRSARERQALPQAIGYFVKLHKDTNCPPDLRAQALSGYGETCMQMGTTAEARTNYTEAIQAFDLLSRSRDYSNSPLAVLALGQKGNCFLQLRDYTNATLAYQQLLDARGADAVAKAIATIGLGLVAEKEAQDQTGAAKAAGLARALGLYLDVFYDDDLTKSEDPRGVFWVKEAGLDAARLAESLKQWSQAAGIYADLAKSLPPLRDFFAAKQRLAQKNIPPAAD